LEGRNMQEGRAICDPALFLYISSDNLRYMGSA